MKKGFILFVVICLSVFLITSENSYGQEKLKVFISVDMEGIAGVVNGDHTYSGGSVFSIKVNDMELGESEQNALIAGCYDVPIVLVTGDRTVCGQVKKSLGEEVETAVVKEGIGRYAAKSLTPEAAQALIEEKAKIALENRKHVKPLKLQPPYRFELTYLRSAMADAGELIPQVKRTGPRTVVFETEDYIVGYKLFRALISLAQ